MRLSAATSRVRPIVVKFEGGDLNATYRPTSYTPKKLAEAQAKAKKAKKANDQDAALASMIESVLDLFVSWDLEDDDGTPIPLTAEALQDVPINVMSELIQEVGRDQQAGDSSTP